MGTEDNFTTVAVLGRGSSGVVKKVHCKDDNKFYACKIIHFREGEISLTEVHKECATLKRLHHPHIVEYIDYRWQPNKVKLYMEYCSGGDLRDFILECKRLERAISESQVWSVLSQIACALLHCHYGIQTTPDGKSQPTMPSYEWDPIIHRDIKPANIFIDTKVVDNSFAVKLGDFGLSRIIDTDTMPTSYAGTRQYQPPEIARANPNGIRWTKKCDIFSLGCTLYEMCTWKAPFSWRMDETDVFDEIPSMYSERLRRCITSCLAFHPEQRHDAFDLLRLVRRTINEPEIGHLVGQLPDRSHGPGHKSNEHHIPQKADADESMMSGALLEPRSAMFDKSSNELNPRCGEFPDRTIKSTALRRQQSTDPLTVINLFNQSDRIDRPTPSTEHEITKAPATEGTVLRVPCPFCAPEFSTNEGSCPSEELQDHFEKVHTDRHGRYLCGVDRCRLYKGAGAYSEIALLEHFKSAHAGKAVERVHPADRRMREDRVASPTITSSSQDVEKWFCTVPKCEYGPDKFDGFFYKFIRDDHMLDEHNIFPANTALNTLVYNIDSRVKARFKGKESVVKDHVMREEQQHRRAGAVQRAEGSQTPPRGDRASSGYKHLIVRQVGSKFYCSDFLCPYSIGFFPGFDTPEQGKRHIQTHPGWKSAKNIFVAFEDDELLDGYQDFSDGIVPDSPKLWSILANPSGTSGTHSTPAARAQDVPEGTAPGPSRILPESRHRSVSLDPDIDPNEYDRAANDASLSRGIAGPDTDSSGPTSRGFRSRLRDTFVGLFPKYD